MLIYPKQADYSDYEKIDFNNPSLYQPVEKIDEIGKRIISLFKRK